MFLNEEVIEQLSGEIDQPESGMSSHWKECLSGFDQKDNGTFAGKGLPEGCGSTSSRWSINELVHWVLQTPYRLQGKRFSKFGKFLKVARKIHKNRNNYMRLGTLRQVISLSFLEDKVKLSHLNEPVVVIGDGFGLMSSLLLASGCSKKVVAVNLTQALLIDAAYIMRSIPGEKLALVANENEYLEALNDSSIKCVLIQADNSNLISLANIGIVINICSMQEMNLQIIADYFYNIRLSKNQKTLFYCANRLEKTLPDGAQVNFRDYPWHESDKVLIDELCPWQQKFYRSRPPFYFPYDGPIQHRLAWVHKMPK